MLPYLRLHLVPQIRRRVAFAPGHHRTRPAAAKVTPARKVRKSRGAAGLGNLVPALNRYGSLKSPSLSFVVPFQIGFPTAANGRSEHSTRTRNTCVPSILYMSTTAVLPETIGG